jgi:hypothetical protein
MMPEIQAGEQGERGDPAARGMNRRTTSGPGMTKGNHGIFAGPR